MGREEDENVTNAANDQGESRADAESVLHEIISEICICTEAECLEGVAGVAGRAGPFQCRS